MRAINSSGQEVGSMREGSWHMKLITHLHLVLGLGMYGA